MVVLDSSAILAVINKETGSEIVQDHLGAAMMCSVNVTEVITKLIDNEWSMQEAATTFETLGVHVIIYDKVLALRAGALREQTKRRGLSLGDRACLALAERERLPAFTADRNWKDLGLPVEVRLFR